MLIILVFIEQNCMGVLRLCLSEFPNLMTPSIKIHSDANKYQFRSCDVAHNYDVS